MEKGKSFRYFVDLDSTTVRCPCGASACNDIDDFAISKFVKAHLDHTDGRVEETITADGARCLADNHPRDRSYSLLPSNKEKP
jgi:hypothetical protein